MSNLKRRLFPFLKKLTLSTTAKNTYILSSADISLAVLAAVTTALIARNLSPSDFGTFISLWSFLTLVAALLDLGVGAGIIAFVADSDSHEEQNQHIGPALLFLSLIGLGQFFVVFLGVKLWQSLLFPGVDQQLIWLTGLGSGLLIIGRFANDALRAKQAFIQSGIATGIFALFRLILIGLLLIKQQFNLSTSMWVMALSPLVYLSLGFYFLKLPLSYLRWDATTIRKVLGFSSWLGVNQVISSVSNRVDVLLLNRIAGSLSAGIYGTASLMARVFVIITASMNAVFAPRLIQLQEKTQRKKFLFKIGLVIAAGWAAIAMTGVLSRTLISLIFGPQYLDALAPFYILLVATAGLMASIPFTLPVIYLLKKPKVIGILSFVQLIIITGGNLILIPKYGYLAPPVLLVICQLVVILVCGWYTRQWLSSSSRSEVND